MRTGRYRVAHEAGAKAARGGELIQTLVVIVQREPPAVRLFQEVDFEAVAFGIQKHRLPGPLRRDAHAAKPEPAVAITCTPTHGLPQPGAAAARIEAPIPREGMACQRES